MALTGSIVQKQLEFSGHFYDFPVKDVEVGESVLIHVWGKNTSPDDEKLGMYWLAISPHSGSIEEYEDWQSFNTDPGETHHFIGGRFTLPEEGRYMIQIKLYIENPDSLTYFKGKRATLVGSTYIEMCTAVAPIEEKVWKLLSTISIAVSPLEGIKEWVLLSTINIAVSPIEGIKEWVLVCGPISISVTPGEPVVECTTDEQCPIGFVCVGGKCVPGNGDGGNGEEEEEVNWPLLLAGGVGLACAAVIILGQREKRKAQKQKVTKQKP
jgi:hypothetical protein